MPTSPTGNRPLYHYPSRWGSRPRLQRVSRPAVCRGVTLMELMVVLAIITLIVGISFPSTIAGLESIRLAAGARSVAAFMNIAANRAERRQQAIELSISIKENSVTMRSPDAAFVKKLDLPPGIAVQAVWPALPAPSDEPRRFLLQPGGDAGAGSRVARRAPRHRGCPAACNKSSTEPRQATNSSRTRSRSPPQLRSRANDSSSHRFRPAQPHPRTQRGAGAVHLGHYFVSQSTHRGLSRRRRQIGRA